MKKAISLLLVLSLFVPLFSVFGSAVSLYDGMDALNAQFLDGAYPRGMDYVYYSPKKGDADTTKYPLLVWLHGMGSGRVPRAQLNWYEFGNFSSEEFQARFDVGGCYLLAVRASDSLINSWNADNCDMLKDTISDFVKQQNGSIDENRLYIAGYSTGGSIVWDMIAQYPNYFAAAAPLAAIFQPTVEELSRLRDTSVWIFASDHDPYTLAGSSDARLAFQTLQNISNRKSGVRFTTVSDARFADGSKRYDLDTGEITADAEHFIWEAFTYDMHMADNVTPYVYTTTVDAEGNTFSFTDPTDGVIRWLSAQKRAPKEEQSKTEMNFFQKLALFFQKIIAYIRNLFT
ncbi:MAG: hypothetical protein IJJ85_08560 [Clostridia bacterium]|nr:hypothetical protein [Clostridia bacterium]